MNISVKHGTTEWNLHSGKEGKALLETFSWGTRVGPVGEAQG